MSVPQQVSYQKIGQNRGTPRLWIEGVKLGAAGFTRGARYTIGFESDRMVLSLDDTGTRRVSGKTRAGRDLPILDIKLRDLEDAFGTEGRVRVVFTPGRITVTLHHETAAKSAREASFRAGLARGELTEASMFTGGGVSTHAVHRAASDYGLTSRLAWVVDAELKYLQVGFANNYAITDQTTALIGRAEEIEPQFFRSVNVLSFSMPCSGFSLAGKSKHRQAPEAHEGAAALFGTLSAIRAANPAVLISENVAEARDSAAYVLLKTELVRLGYRISERIMTQADTGSLEDRKRYWLTAVSDGLAGEIDDSLVHAGSLLPPARLADILEAEIPESAWHEHAYLKEKAERDRAAGKGFTRQILDGTETRCGTIGRFYSKHRSTEPMLARADGKERILTPVEHARVKSAPEALVAETGAALAHEILGQSVDYRQAYLAMGSVLAAITGELRGQVARIGDAARAVTARVAESAEAVRPKPDLPVQAELF